MSEANMYQNFYQYTRSSYWGGSAYPYWLLMLITLVFGLLGLDHIMLRSPGTAALKLIVNILGLGFWWFYDILQIYGNKDMVMKHGLTAPFLGPIGIGAGTFTDINPVKQPTSSFRTILYFLLVILPIPVFGLDFLVAGDTNGAIAKCLSMIIPLLWPFAIIWSLATIGTTIFNPQYILEKGTYRMFPFSWFMDSQGPSVIGPKEIKPSEGTTGFFGTLLQWAILAIPGVGPAVQGVAAATQATAAAVQAGATAVKTGANAASDVIQAAKGPAVTTIGLASGLAQQIPSAVTSATGAADIVGSQLKAFTDPQTLQSLASGSQQYTWQGYEQPYRNKYEGGGVTKNLESITNVVPEYALYIFFGAVLLGGLGMSLKRLGVNLIPKKTDEPRNDTPPNPRTI